MTDHTLAPSDPATIRATLERLGVKLPLRADVPDAPGSIFANEPGRCEIITADQLGTMDDDEARELAQLVAAAIKRAAGIEP